MDYADSQVVDSEDNVIGRIQLPEALKTSAILQVARLYLFNTSGDFLLQQRGPDVLAPNLWNEAASGHVDAGESYLSTIVRETQEELGLTLDKKDFQKIDYAFTEEKYGDKVVPRFQTVFMATIPDDTIIRPEAEEVSATLWVSISDLDAWVAKDAKDFTKGFLHFYERYRDNTSQQ